MNPKTPQIQKGEHVGSPLQDLFALVVRPFAIIYLNDEYPHTLHWA